MRPLNVPSVATGNQPAGVGPQVVVAIPLVAGRGTTYGSAVNRRTRAVRSSTTMTPRPCAASWVSVSYATAMLPAVHPVHGASA